MKPENAHIALAPYFLFPGWGGRPPRIEQDGSRTRTNEAFYLTRFQEGGQLRGVQVLSSYAVDTAKAPTCAAAAGAAGRQQSAETQHEISMVSFALLRPCCGFAVCSWCNWDTTGVWRIVSRSRWNAGF